MVINNDDIEAFQEPGRIDNPTTPLGMVKQYAKATEQTPNASLYYDLILEEYNEWREEYHKVGGNPVDELKELADLIYVLYGYANAIGWDLDEAVNRVHQNNLGRMYQEDGTIKRRADGKIEKNKNYPKVTLEDLV